MNFRNLKLQQKLLLIAIISLVFLVVLGVLFYLILNNQQAITYKIVTNQKALYYFQDGDMMHDAIRADVLLSQLKNFKETEELNTVFSDFTEHQNQFLTDISEMEKLDLDQKKREQLNRVKPMLNDYINFAKEIIHFKRSGDSLLKASEVELTNKIAKLSMFTDSLSVKLLAEEKYNYEHINEYCEKIINEQFSDKMKLFYSLFESLVTENGELSKLILEATADEQQNSEAAAKNSRIILISLIILSIIFTTLLSLLIAKRIQRPVIETKEFLDTLSSGDLPNIKQNSSSDEIGQIVNSLNNLTSNLNMVKNFADEVGEGKFDSDVTVFEGKGALGTSLNSMRDSLKKVADEDKRRNWAIAGLAQISETLRSNYNSNNEQELFDNIVSFVTKYTKANQASLFLLNDDNKSEQFLELKACYAYDKKKFLTKKILLGEGLAGQCFIENDIIYMTDVPDKYTTITSGLGEATPNCIILVPLKINDLTNGVLEIASFKVFEEYEVDFLKKIAESIASTVTTIRVNIRTTLLLHQTQQQAEEMRAQEEEMRQNMEELHATQEEQERLANRFRKSESEMKAQFNAIDTSYAFIDFTPEGLILNANDIFCRTMEYDSKEEILGKHHRIFATKEYASSIAYINFWKSLKSGETLVNQYERVTKNGHIVWLEASYAPVFDENKNVVKVIKLAKDITKQKLLEISNSEKFSKIEALEEEFSKKEQGYIAEIAKLKGA